MNCIQGAPSRPGPEADLVQSFVQVHLPAICPGKSRFTFIEPHVEQSRPDIVVVYWDSATARKWPQERRLLESMDLRLAHFLYLSGPLSEAEIRQVFPYRPTRLLERLDKAGIVARANDLWGLKRLADVFAVRRIVAFEAKISALSRALEQALRNTWFASESYVLTTSANPHPRIIEQAGSLGVGLWTRPSEAPPVPLVKAIPRQVPQSYASWLFNELMWKTSLGVAYEC